METPAHIAAQRIVGGSLALDLLNTQNGPAGGTPEDDALRDYADVVAWGAYVGCSVPRRPSGWSGGHAATRTAARAVFARVLETRGYLYELFRGDRDRPEPAARRHRPAAGATRPTRWPTGSSSGSTTPTSGAGPTTTWGDRCGPSSTRRMRLLTDGDAGSRQGLRAVPVPLPRPEQEPQPAVVLDGRLRHRRQDGEVRGAPGVRPIGDRPDLAEQLEPVEVDAAVAQRRGSRSCARPTPPRSPGRPRAGTASSRRRGRPCRAARRRR